MPCLGNRTREAQRPPGDRGLHPVTAACLCPRLAPSLLVGGISGPGVRLFLTPWLAAPAVPAWCQAVQGASGATPAPSRPEG